MPLEAFRWKRRLKEERFTNEDLWLDVMLESRSANGWIRDVLENIHETGQSVYNTFGGSFQGKRGHHR